MQDTKNANICKQYRHENTNYNLNVYDMSHNKQF